MHEHILFPKYVGTKGKNAHVWLHHILVNFRVSHPLGNKKSLNKSIRN